MCDVQGNGKLSLLKIAAIGLSALITIVSLGNLFPAFSIQSFGWNPLTPSFEPMPQILIARDGTSYRSYWTNYIGAAGGTTLVVEACQNRHCYKAFEMDGDVAPQMCLLDGTNLLIVSQITRLSVLYPFVSPRYTTKRGTNIRSTITFLAPTIFIANLSTQPGASQVAPTQGPIALGENGFADPAKPNICGVTAR